VRSGGATAGAVQGTDLEQHPYLRQAESDWLERAVGLAADGRQKLLLEMGELDAGIGQLEALLAKGCEANPDLKMSKEEVEAMVRAQLEAATKSKGELQ